MLLRRKLKKEAPRWCFGADAAAKQLAPCQDEDGVGDPFIIAIFHVDIITNADLRSLIVYSVLERSRVLSKQKCPYR